MDQPIMDKYCICFCRVSTQQQDLVQQTNSIMLEAERMGYNKDHQIIIEYKESGISLSSNERAGIDKLKDTVINNPNIEDMFEIELSDDEEFDQKKLQLVKSDYEVDFLPYGNEQTLHQRKRGIEKGT